MIPAADHGWPSGMFVATFQTSNAIGSLLGAVMVDASGTRTAMFYLGWPDGFRHVRQMAPPGNTLADIRGLFRHVRY
ncbi:hypothetical protein ACH40F_05380 [Streptomyces sp. NPDC020794]|uniref:hypothetical protein n=1 Tax=unclassified Streptomyces TaxID=2593676 RepID=UPI0036EE5F32